MADRPPVRLDYLESLPLSRRELLLGAGGLVLAGTLAGCGSSGSSSASSGGGGGTGTPKPGGNFRLGVTGGGSKDIIDGQSIITKPDQARLVAGFETLLVYDSQYKLPSAGGTQEGLASEVTQDLPDQWTIKLRDGIDVPQRQGVDSGRRDLFAQAHPGSQRGAVRHRRPGLDRPQADDEDGQPDGASEAEGAGLDYR